MTRSEFGADRRLQGIVLVLVSALVFSTAGLFTKGVEADAWSVIFWRGLAAFLFTIIYLAFRGHLKAEARQMTASAWWAAIFMAAGTAAFIPAFKLTSIANVALIYAAAPFVSGALAWIILREKPTKIVLLASLAAFCGVGLIVSGSLGTGDLAGNALALWMTLMMSATMVIYRRRPETPAALPAALSSLMLLPVAYVFGEPVAMDMTELPILIAFGLVFAVASVTLSEGARRLPPAETALLSAMETPLASVWAWLLFLEFPAATTVIGGTIIMAAILGSQMRLPHRARSTLNRA